MLARFDLYRRWHNCYDLFSEKGAPTFIECMGRVCDCLLAVYSLLNFFSRRKLLALQKVALSILAMTAA